MSKKIVYLAVAGAGKTYSICNNLDLNKRNLILSYTNENVLNIHSELAKKYGSIPSGTIVETFDSFMLDNFIWPVYKKIQSEVFHKRFFERKIIDFNRPIINPAIGKFPKNKNDFNKYFSLNSDRMSYSFILYEAPTLIMNMDLKFNDGNSIFSEGMFRILNFFDCIYIDEFQDYRDEKFDLLLEIMKYMPQGYLYGDYYQHSVSGMNNSGRPFTKKTTYESFMKDLRKQGFEIDNTTLLKTRRCSENICSFIRTNLGIEFYSDDSMGRIGEIKYIFNSDVLKSLLNNHEIAVLSLNNNKTWGSISFGLSKGNTYKNTIVVIPDTNLKNDKEAKVLSTIKEGVSKNKIYVALTRSTGNVYMTDKSTMELAKKMEA